MLARRIAYPIRLAARRVRAAGRPLSVAAFGVGLAACALAGALAASAIVENRAVADAIDELPANARNVEVTWIGLSASPAESLSALDRQAHAALGAVGLVPEARTLVYRETRLDGHVIQLAAFDDLARWLVVRSGRLPRVCTAARCETVAVGGGPVPRIPRLPVVGVAEPRPGTAARRLLGTTTGRTRTLVTGDVAAAERLTMLASVFRSYAWSAPLASARPTAWTLSEFERNVTRARTRLQTASFRFGLNAPVDSLDDAALDARVAYRRLLLIGGECAVLLLVFAVVAASTLRSSAGAASRRLRRFGARRWQADLLAAGEATAIVLPAVAVGWAVGGLVIAFLARATDTPRTALLERTVLSATGLAVAASLAAMAVLILFGTMRANAVVIGGRALAVVDTLAVAAIIAVAIALALGETNAETLAHDRSTGIALLLVPALVLLAGAIVAARLAAPVFRLAERLAPRARPSLRLALLSATRSPGTQLVTVAFLVVSVGLAMFAASYRSTLLAGEQDEAAFAVPLDYVVRKAGAGRAAGEPSVGAAYARRNAVPVIRRTGQAASLNLSETIDVLGVPSGALERLRWRQDFAASGPAALGDAIAPPQPLRPVGPLLSPDAKVLRLPVTVRGDPFTVTADIRTAEGSYLAIGLGEARRGRTVLRGSVPDAAGSGTLVGLTLDVPPAKSFSAAHAAAEGGAPDVFTVGRLALGQPRILTSGGPKPVPVDYRLWVSATESSRAASTTAETLQVRYLLTDERPFRLRPRQPTDGRTVPVIACGSLADRVGSDGVVPLSLGSADLRLEIVARASLFPTLRCPFVVADEGTLETAVSAVAPGAAVADEAWVSAPPMRSRSLERAGDGISVAVTSRRQLEAELRDDPLARGTVALLAAGSLLALVLAVAAVLLVISVELRDESGSLYDLESQGMAPAMLRRQLGLRIAIIAAFGVLCGLATGAVLTAIVTELVAVGAGRGAPIPPLRLDVAWPDIALGLVCLGVALTLVLIASTRRAFAEPVPARGRDAR